MTLREEVARAICKRLGINENDNWSNLGIVADAAIALIVERCAKVADDYELDPSEKALRIAARIRALTFNRLDSPAPPSHVP